MDEFLLWFLGFESEILSGMPTLNQHSHRHKRQQSGSQQERVRHCSVLLFFLHRKQELQDIEALGDKARSIAA
jgi:hypothetical protein